MANVYQQLSEIDTLIFDVDGVFTPSHIILSEQNEWLRIMHTQDGYAVKRALKAGFNVGIITKAISKPVRDRFEQLGVEHIYQVTGSKLDAFHDLMTKFGNCTSLYMGDDLSDLEVMDLVSVAACPYDAVYEVQEKCQFISARKGGNTCVRDIIERVLRIKNLW